MKQITTKDQERIEALKQKINELHNYMDGVITNLNQVYIDPINALIAELNGVRDDIANEIQTYIDGRSENWKDSDKGTAYSNWYEAWAEEIEELDQIEVPDYITFAPPMEPDAT